MRLGLGLRVGGGFVKASYLAETLAYIAAVEAADGQPLETLVKIAYNNFIVGCKADGNWTAIKACCILAGARSLAGALVPLVGSAPTSFNFVGADYNRKTGLVGNGTTKYLNSNYAYSAAMQNNCHIAVNATTIGAGVFIGGVDDSNSGSFLGATFNRLYSTAPSTFVPSNTTTTGFRGSSRSASGSFLYRRASADETASIASAAITHPNFTVFARIKLNGTLDNYSASRLAFYSMGEAVDLALLDARVTTLINALGALP